MASLDIAEPLPADIEAGGTEASLLAFSLPAANGCRTLNFAVPDAYCSTCITTIEAALTALPDVRSARVNLSNRRVQVVFDPAHGTALGLAPAIEASGYRTHVLDPAITERGDPALWELVRAMAVAGFAAGNIMLFSVSVWAGADDATRNMFHWLSALIALPSIAYAGLPFYRSAFAALRAGRTNMDVPITIGICLATGLSLYETITSGAHAYFDASTMLLFFLLAGRSLDHLMRQRARSAIANLALLAPRGATRIAADGTLGFVAIDQIQPGDQLLVRPGDRVPVDCTVREGAGEIDNSLVTGESLPVAFAPGAELVAGAMNLTSGLRVEVVRKAADSYLARITEMMEAAESTRTRYRRIADRAAAIYAPVLHLTAIVTFLAWGLLTHDWHNALINAVAVLIITCPCALALAVPMVQTVATARLFRSGIMMRDGAAIERAASVQAVVFDKTGTLTQGEPELDSQLSGEPSALATAASVASHSTHGLARALLRAYPAAAMAGTVNEYPGAGVEVRAVEAVWRLGSAAFCNAPRTEAGDERSRVYLARDGKCIAAFALTDHLRPDAQLATEQLREAGLDLEILSGDLPGPVGAVADALEIAVSSATQTPAEKLDRVLAYGAAGERVMMVGDGINDAPSLRAAFVSMAPSSASDIGRSAADFIYTNDRLLSVPFTIRIARRAQRLVVENLGIAIIYNALALPLAIAGQVTPLIAALAMSGSSILVVANAMRLNLGRDLAPALSKDTEQ